MKFHDFITGMLCLLAALSLSCTRPLSKQTANQSHTMQKETLHKSLIRDFYRRAVAQGDIAFAEQLISEHYIQHSSALKPGKAGVLEALNLMKQMPKPTAATAPFMRLIAEDEYVVTNLSFDWGGKQKVVVDLFRFENGQVAEHWDAVQDQPETTANGNAMMNGPLPTENTALTATNKTIALAFYQRIFVDKHLQALPEFVVADLIQHNPDMANGLDGLHSYLHSATLTISKIHRAISEGDFVVIQAEGQLAGNPTMVYEILRFDQGKIAEQWTVKSTL
ncbi:nuclear transport factor 2 family protein [Spirosoma horti]